MLEILDVAVTAAAARPALPLAFIARPADAAGGDRQ